MAPAFVFRGVAHVETRRPETMKARHVVTNLFVTTWLFSEEKMYEAASRDIRLLCYGIGRRAGIRAGEREYRRLPYPDRDKGRDHARAVDGRLRQGSHADQLEIRRRA